MPRITPIQVALAVGASGAFVDVTTWANLNVGVALSEGRSSAFGDFAPGVFSFTLDNADGRFTPGNPSSPYGDRVREGVQVCVQVGTRLSAGRVQSVEPVFREGVPSWAEVVLTCEDMLGQAAKTDIATGFRDALVAAAEPLLFYPLNDAEGSTQAAEQSGTNGFPLRAFPASSFTFEVGAANDSVMQVTWPAGGGASLAARDGRTYAPGWVSFWVQPRTNNAGDFLYVGPYVLGYSAGSIFARDPASALSAFAPAFTIGRSYFVELDLRQNGADIGGLYVDGVFVDTLPFYAGSVYRAPSFSFDGISGAGASGGDMYLWNVAYTTTRAEGGLFVAAQTDGGAASWLNVLAALTPDFTLNTLPTALSSNRLRFEADGGMSALEAFEDVMRAEQGYMFSVTTGTVTAPVEAVTVRERDRPTAVSYSFDAASELAETPDFYRNVRDVVSRVEVDGATRSVLVADAEVAALVGSASISQSVPIVRDGNLAEWGQDRIFRANAPALWVESIVVDAMTTPTSRAADLLAIRQGDRIRVTNLPNTQLGFTTWDGWVVGKEETHSLTQHLFRIYLTAVAPRTGIFDTDRFAGGSDLSLSAGITSSATSFSVATAGERLSTVDVPYQIRVDDERMTVTAVTAATPQVVTVTRAVAGSLAASHLAAARVELSSPAVVGF